MMVYSKSAVKKCAALIVYLSNNLTSTQCVFILVLLLTLLWGAAKGIERGDEKEMEKLEREMGELEKMIEDLEKEVDINEEMDGSGSADESSSSKLRRRKGKKNKKK